MPTDTTPTKNESLPELRQLVSNWMILSDQLVALGDESRNSEIWRIRSLAAELEAALTREAPTEAVNVLPNCPDCKGAGEVMLPVWTPDPQDGYDQLSSCPRCGGNGGLLPASLSDLLHFTEHCISASEEGENYSVPREWLDAMTTMGVMKKAGRSRWSVSDQAATVVAILRAATATPPAPQRQSSNPSGLSSESAPQSSEQRLAQGDSAVALEVYLSTTWGSAAMRIEALATWLDQQEENCGLLSIAAADLRAMSAKLYSEPTGEGDSWFADALTSMGEVIPLPTQPPHQDRGEVEDAWQKIHVLSSVMEFRALTESERRELHGCHVTIRAALTEAKQPLGVVIPDALEHWPLYAVRHNDTPKSKRSDYVDGWNACRNAMIASATGSAPQVEAKRQTGEDQ